ncbi:NFACT family protein, partial [Spirulina subsalsa FACHB-351]
SPAPPLAFGEFMQAADFTTIKAICQELQRNWIPARLEQVYQRDRHTLSLALRTLQGRDWLTLAWHPQAARLCMDQPPPRTPDTFTLSDQLRHQLNGLALIAVETLAPWERVLDLQFAQRPGDPPLWHIYLEIMGKYSNLILTDSNQQIVTTAHQVNEKQSSVRTIQTGQPYTPPPPLLGSIPSLSEPLERWQERVSLIPGQWSKQLLKTYRGVSPQVIQSLAQFAQLDPTQEVQTFSPEQWQQLFTAWQAWLNILDSGQFTPLVTAKGYSVLGWGDGQSEKSVQTLVSRYYRRQLAQQDYQQLRHQLQQKLNGWLKKLQTKAQTFRDRLSQSTEADLKRQQGDLLMTYLHQWQPGMTTITLEDLTTGQPVTIPLNPEKNAVQNAQLLYKQHQKLKRARHAVTPLLDSVEAEIFYLEQVEDTLGQLGQYQTPDDGQTLTEIRDELIQQGYLDAGKDRQKVTDHESQPHRYQTPSGFELWVGRNNRQNDHLTFRVAGDYDLWFHSQEIPGSHILLRLEPGAVAEEVDLQFAADLAAYYSRGRESNQVPVVYTQPKYVYKPKGAKPGMVIYKQETVLWGSPKQGAVVVRGSE